MSKVGHMRVALRLAGAAAAALTAVTALPAAATTGSAGALVVKGNGHSFATIDIPAGVRVDANSWSLTGDGRYRLALLDRVVTNRTDAGFNDLFAVVPSLQVHTALGSDSDTPLPPGKYRLYLGSDKPVQLRLPVRGMKSRTLTAVHAAAVRAWFDAAPDATGGPPFASAEARRDLPLTGSVTFQASRWTFPKSGPHAFDNAMRSCLVGVGARCTSGSDDQGVTLGSSASSTTHVEYWDTFDYQSARGSAVTEFEGTDRPSSVAQFVASISVK